MILFKISTADSWIYNSINKNEEINKNSYHAINVAMS